jgi:hypothetical protein
MINMIHPDEANEVHTAAAHAIAGFQLADIAFGVLVRMGFYRNPMPNDY